MKQNYTFILCFLAFFSSFWVWGQDIIYQADFSNEGDGFPDHTSSSPPADPPAKAGPFGTVPNQWFLSYEEAPVSDTTANFFKVKDGALVSNDWGGQGIFTSQVIDISNISTINIKAKGVNAGANDKEGFTYFYILDGGEKVETDLGKTSNGSPVDYTINNLDVSKNNQIEVGFEFSENGNNQGYIISSYTLTKANEFISIVGFDTSTSLVSETNNSFNISIPVSVSEYFSDFSLSVTVDATSTAETTDYNLNTESLNFNSTGTQNISLTIHNDEDADTNESIILNLALKSGNAILNTSQHIINIVDNDVFVENFTKSNLVSSYRDSSFVGNYGITWSYIKSRNNNNDANAAGIEGKAIMLRSREEGSKISSSPISGGIKDFSTILYKGFTGVGNRQVELFINGESKGVSVEFDDPDDKDKYIFEVNDINISGNFTIEIRNIKNKQVIIDDITWTPLPSAKWTGNTNSDWDTASNWSTNSPPRATDDLVIPSGLTNYPTISSEVTVNSLTVKPGASLISSATVNGKLNYERSLASDRWYLLSSPLSGESIENIFINHSLATGSKEKLGWAPFVNTGEDAWNYQTETSKGNLTSGQGYAVKLASTGNIIFSGSVNTSDVLVGVTTGTRNNFNLIGNPFTSYINATKFFKDNTDLLSEETIWLWDGTRYLTKNNINAIEIAPGQGFFIDASKNGSIKFAASNQSHKKDSFTRRSYPNPSFELFAENKQDKSSTKVFFVKGKTRGFDNGYDSKIFEGTANKFSVYTELVSNGKGKKLAIQTLPDSDYDMLIPVGLHASSGTKIKFSVKSINMPAETQIYLEDKLNNTFINLSEQNYSTIVKNKTKGAGQFYIHLTTKTIDEQNSKDTLVDLVSIYKSDSNELTVEGLQSKNNLIVVYTTLGQKVIEKNINSSGLSKIYLPELSKGIYIVELFSDSGKKISKKIVFN
ncbi:MAG: T9SS type A sorting domain-containing protein [Tenacibaculum sp.]